MLRRPGTRNPRALQPQAPSQLGNASIPDISVKEQLEPKETNRSQSTAPSDKSDTDWSSLAKAVLGPDVLSISSTISEASTLVNRSTDSESTICLNRANSCR